MPEREDDQPDLCHRCGCELHAGAGDFYVVKIEAFADPSPPVIESHGLTLDPRREIERIAEALQDLSPQEALDQVYRRLTLTLCSTCYRRWIENPTAS